MNSTFRVINSEHNKILKHLRKVSESAKYRRKNRQTIIEGVNLTRSFLDSGQTPVLVFFTESALDNSEAREIIEDTSLSGVDKILVGESNFSKVSDLENGIGIGFLVEIPDFKSVRIDRKSILLENLQDPGNLGTILRTSVAAGIDRVYISSGSVSAWSPKVLRAGMGAHFGLEIYENCELKRLILDANVPILATSLQAKKTIYQQDLKNVAWLFGNEGNGVSDELMELNVRPVIIPQSDKIESLNVAASVAICLFEQVRQEMIDG